MWAVAFFAGNTYSNIHGEFELLREDIIPGTIAMGEMEKSAAETAHELMDYIIYGEEESKQIALSATKDLEKMGLEHLEHEIHIGQEEQKEAEHILEYFSVLEISDDGENEVKVRINHKVEQAILRCPEYYKEQFDKIA